MKPIDTLPDVEYPESDGMPMAETEVHLEWTIYVRDILKWQYREQQVYVGCDMFVYYVEGEPSACVAPDIFVVKDCDPGRRRIFQTWAEGRVPDVAIELTSRSTRRVDSLEKPQRYAQIGIKEYILFDPTVEYLQPPLQGFWLDGDAYVRIEPDASGALFSEALGIRMRLEDRDLVLYDVETGERLYTRTEVAESDLDASKAESQAERNRRREAEAKRREAEAKRR